MKFRLLFSALFVGVLSMNAYAQHSDIEIGYDSTSTPTSLIVEAVETTSDGFAFFEAEFENLDPFDLTDFSANEPGITTNPDDPLLVNPDDQIWLRVLDASAHSSFGVGFVNYYNPTTDAVEAFGRIGIEDNSGSTSDLVLDGASIESGDNPQFVDFGDVNGGIHDHVIFDLLDDATTPNGAYGLLLQFHSDFDVADGNFDLTSDPFWIVLNHGMTEEDFESLAVPQFGITAVPEPSFAIMSVLVIGGIGLRRRRE